jgi:hypothetical protein
VNQIIEDMSAKQFTAPRKVALLALRAAKRPGLMIVLLAISLLAGGCATTSSQAAKPHKPQMITSDGVEVVGGFNPPAAFDNGFNLSDGWANFVEVVGRAFGFYAGVY